METETVFETVRLLIGDWAEKFETPAPNRIDVYMKRKEDLFPAVAGLRVKKLGYLSGITGLDPGTDSQALEVLYHFCPGPVVIHLRVPVPKAEATVASLSSIIPNAESFERELSEMFGIKVTGLRNTDEYLYLPEDWKKGVYPLRKDLDAKTLAKLGR